MSDNQKAIIIVAGGKGTRMGVSLPKQFIRLGGKPILMHTIERFYTYDKQIRIILVLPEDQQDFWKDLCKEYRFDISVDIANGGDTRFHSVLNGIRLLHDEKWVGIHDGVRPFVSYEVIANCFESVQTLKAVIPTIPIVETVRFLKGETSTTVNRDEYCLVQTPQVFCSELLKRAYQQNYNSHFTDDASVVEALGQEVSLISGNRENIKVTTPFDLKIGETLL